MDLAPTSAPSPSMTVSEFHLVAPDGHLYALDSPRFQSLHIRIGDLLVRADLTQPIHLPAHDRRADPGRTALSTTTCEPAWSGRIRVDPVTHPARTPLWKATFRGPRSAVAEQMSAAILDQLRSRLRAPAPS